VVEYLVANEKVEGSNPSSRSKLMANDKVQAHVLEAIIRCIPSNEQLRDFDFSEPKVVRFGWRAHHFRVTEEGFVEEVEGKMLHSNDLAAMFRALLKKTLDQMYVESIP
jgi:hypothetical protein